MASGDSARVLLPRYELARQGRIFSGNIAAAGVVLPIYSNTTQQVGLWNPAGSSVDIVLLRINLTYIDTTAAAGGYVLGYLNGAGASAATGAPIAAFTETAAVNTYIGNGRQQIAKFAQGATITLTSAAAILTSLSLNQNAFTAAGTGQMAYENSIQYGGEIVLPPNTAVFVAGNIATLAKWSGSLVWAEVDKVA